MVSVDGKLTAMDPEVISIAQSDAYGATVPVKALVTGRRLHSGLCENFMNERRREADRRELAAYNRDRKNRTL
jgi:hypothetical protein